MGFFARILTVGAMVWVAGLPANAFEGPSQADAKDKPAASQPAAASGETASPATIQAYEAGIKAYQDGKTDLAIRALSKALNGGGLESPKMAKALYYRGMSYRKKDKPGLAISDLTSAIWLKDGLDYASQQEAMSARIAAYREAGISDVPQLPAGSVMMASSGDSAAGGGWQTATADQGPPVGSLDATGPQYAPPSPSQPQSSSSGGGIGGFFNSVTNGVTSLFGGGSSSSSSSDEDVTTASLSSSNEASTSAASWSGNTEVAVSSSQAGEPAPFVTQVATASPAASGMPSGKYRLQIASVRSRVEADNLAHRVVAEYGADLGPRAPIVDEAVIGSMGTFYRVRVGPYANAAEPQKLCGKLQANGFDCLVVTQ